MSKTKILVAYRVNLSEADGCDRDGCDGEPKYVHVYLLEDGDVVHTFACEKHDNPLGQGTPVGEEEEEDEEAQKH